MRFLVLLLLMALALGACTPGTANGNLSGPRPTVGGSGGSAGSSGSSY